ncbi:MAG: RHS repeat-associated core domain-containing protein [Chitinophagia bacterium]
MSSKKLPDQTGNEGNTTNSYLYNDKELFEDGDLGWYDYGFRQYDAQLGRFIEIDPLTDDYTLLSGYHYALNDPVSNVDVDGLSSVNPLLQMVQCQGVVLQESIKIGLTQAISGLANGLAQNLQQKNTAQQVGKQGGGTDLKPSTQRSLDGVKGGPTAFEMNQRMEVFAQMEWQRIVRKSWVHKYANIWENSVTGQVWAKPTAIQPVYPELAVMPLPKFGLMTKIGRLFGIGVRATEVVSEITVPKYLYHYTSNEAAESILKTGLTVTEKRPFIYTTDVGTLTPFQAQIELALPANKALPNAILRIDVSGLKPALIRKVTGNLPGLGAGGGREFLFNQNIPSNLIKRIK